MRCRDASPALSAAPSWLRLCAAQDADLRREAHDFDWE